jgi:hypothetical protein
MTLSHWAMPTVALGPTRLGFSSDLAFRAVATEQGSRSPLARQRFASRFQPADGELPRKERPRTKPR